MATKQTAAQKAAAHETDANDAIAEADAATEAPEPTLADLSDDELAAELRTHAGSLTGGEWRSAQLMEEAARRLAVE